MTNLASTFDRRLDTAVELALQIASGDLDARSTVSERGDAIDAVVSALNMLAEELSHERKSRRLAEEALLDEVEAYETAPALFCSLDGESLTVENCNQTLALALGLAKPTIIGRSLLDLYAPECRDMAERWLRALPLGASADGSEALLCRASGGHVVVSTAASRIRSNTGRDRVRVVFRDVTAERRLESQLAQAQKLEAIGRLSGGVAHDFNNILSVVAGAASLLADLLAAQSLESEDIVLIEEAVARGASLTRDLLAFSRRQVNVPVSTDVRAILLEARRMIGRLLDEHIVVTSELPAEPMNVLIDGSQLSQVLINLAINARDAMGGTGGRLHMAAAIIDPGLAPTSLDLPPAPGYARIRVTDSGDGMTDEVRAQAFEPFFTTKPPGKGSGLGLSVCHGLIRQAGGRILLHSLPGEGTTVEMFLPLTSGTAPALLRGACPPSGGRERVLVVEDDLAVGTVARRVLERAGYQVLAAQSGLEALELAERVDYEFDAVVSDVTMPGMGGIELGAALRRRNPSLRVLFLSGYAENLPASKPPNEPGSDFLGKPFTASTLLARVRRLIDDRAPASSR
jgi:two-component system cell cycle sensor histidine kinase/response regulator CckA